MASKYGDGEYPTRKRKDPENEFELIPIFFRLPDYGPVDLVTGYLEEKQYPKKQKKRFYGYYICETCHNRPIWTSGYSWQGYRQECKRCQVSYWPYMVYHLEKSKAKGKKYEKPHKSELCEKCQEDGVHCLTKLPLKDNSEQAHPANFHVSDDIEDENEFTIYFAKQYELERNLIKIEPQYIWNLFDSLWHILPREGKADFKEALERALQHWKKAGRGDMTWVCKQVRDEIRYYS